MNSVYCDFAEAVYDKFLQKRYGINSCKTFDKEMLYNELLLEEQKEVISVPQTKTYTPNNYITI